MEQEKNKVKIINSIGVLLLIVATGLLYYYFNGNKNILTGEKSTVSTFTDLGQPLGADIVNCEFRVISHFSYENKKDPWGKENRKIYYETTEESKPNVITFANISTQEPKIKGNMGDGLLIPIENNNEKIVLSEKNDLGDIFIYTIFKNEKIATWYKSYKIVDIPYGMLSMGYCY